MEDPFILLKTRSGGGPRRLVLIETFDLPPHHYDDDVVPLLRSTIPKWIMYLMVGLRKENEDFLTDDFYWGRRRQFSDKEEPPKSH